MTQASRASRPKITTEASNHKGDMFGDDRLDQAIAAAEDTSPQAVIDSINAAVGRFTNGAPPADDRTLVVLRRKP